MRIDVYDKPRRVLLAMLKNLAIERTEHKQRIRRLEQHVSDLYKVGDEMQSEGSRMAEFVKDEAGKSQYTSPARPGYEVHMAAVGFPIDAWTRLRLQTREVHKMPNKTFSFTVDTEKLEERFNKGVESAKKAFEVVTDNVKEKVNDSIAEDKEKLYDVVITLTNTSGGTRKQFVGTSGAIAWELRKLIEAGNERLHLTVNPVRDEAEEAGDQ